MLRLLKKITHTPETQTLKYAHLSFDEASSLLNEKITSREGTFGIEWVKTKRKSEYYFFMSQFSKPHLQGDDVFKVMLPRDSEYYTYSAFNDKSSCFPFKMDYRSNIWTELADSIRLNDEILFMQVSFQKLNNDWQNRLKRQYQDYLRGIEYPTDLNFLRDLQYKALDFIKTKEEWIGENPEIYGAEKKFEEIGFRTQIRFAVFGNKKPSQNIANQIGLVFNQLSYANKWIISREKHHSSKLTQLQNRKFSILRSQTILCMSEVLPLFCARKTETKKSVDDNTVPTRISFKLPSLSHLPKGSSEHHEHNYIKQEELINATLNKIGLIENADVKVNDISQGATVKRITFTLPKGLNYSAFSEKVVKDIRSHLGKNVSVVMGSIPNSVALTIPLEKRQKVFLRDIIETEEFKQFAKENPLPLVVGMDETGAILMTCLTKLPHLLGSGSTGSGKSVWLNCLLLTLLLTKTPDELCIYIIDPKQVEFLQFIDFPHVKKVATLPEQVTPLFESLIAEMTRRYSLFAESKCRSISQYNAKSTNPLKYIVCIVDELGELIMTVPEATEYVIRLGQLARACGINMIVTTQRPSTSIGDRIGDLKAQLPARLALKCASRHDYSTILDTKMPYQLLGHGDGVCYGIPGLDGLIRFQGALIADGDEATDKVIEKVLNEWNDILKGSNFKAEQLPEVKRKPTPTPLERAKFLICEEGKITQRSLSKALETRNENVKPFLDDLVKENWLTAPENSRSGYQVSVSAEEIETFGIWFRNTFDSQFWGIQSQGNIDSDKGNQ